MKFKKALLGGLAAISLLTSGLTVAAASGECALEHQRRVVYDMSFLFREKTREHEVDIDGRQAMCYVYTEYYDVTYYCQICHEKYHCYETYTEQHSICPK